MNQMDHNRMYNANYRDAVDRATNVKEHILELIREQEQEQYQEQNQEHRRFPQHCRLELENEWGDINNFEAFVCIRFTSPHSASGGWVMAGHPAHFQPRNPNVDKNGFLHIECSLDAINGGFFMDISVNNIDEMLTILEFCQNLLAYQPEGMIDFVRIPPHMMDRWFVPEYLRQRNLQARYLDEYDNQNGGNVVPVDAWVLDENNNRIEDEDEDWVGAN
jgi:hypothetical protein